MKTLINTYNQGDSIITQYLISEPAFVDNNGDVVYYKQVETYRDGNWCQTEAIEA